MVNEYNFNDIKKNIEVKFKYLTLSDDYYTFCLKRYGSTEAYYWASLFMSSVLNPREAHKEVLC